VVSDPLLPPLPLIATQAPGPLLEPERRDLPDLVRQLHGDSLPWMPAGQASRLHWGPPLQAATAVVSIRRLDRILEHNPGDFTVTVEAGAPLAELQEALRVHDQWLAVDTPWGDGALGSGSVGGLVARGLAGGYRERHLGVRDQLIGIELLRADGVAARAGGRVVKNVAGYDLMRLFTGSWGSLGLITAVTLRTLPLPPHRAGLVLQGDPGELADLCRWLLAADLTPERVDRWSPALAQAADLDPRPLLLIGLASVSREALEEQVRGIGSRTALPARRLDAAALAALLAVARGTTRDGVLPGPWLLRLAVDPAAVGELLACREVEGLAVEIAAGSGLGLAWCPDREAAARLTAEAVGSLRRRCRSLGGHLTVLLQPSPQTLPAWEDAPARALIEAVKRRFDPHGQLAPGRLPGVAPPPAQSGDTR
jgi:glycolate oxidase FAD binding subunit